jgi:hypothetical protein
VQPSPSIIEIALILRDGWYAFGFDDGNGESSEPGDVFRYGHKIQLDLAIFSGLLSDRTT